jgi:Ca2+-binding RTX toxin-like protein
MSVLFLASFALPSIPVHTNADIRNNGNPNSLFLIPAYSIAQQEDDTKNFVTYDKTGTNKKMIGREYSGGFGCTTYADGTVDCKKQSKTEYDREYINYKATIIANTADGGSNNNNGNNRENQPQQYKQQQQQQQQQLMAQTNVDKGHNGPTDGMSTSSSNIHIRGGSEPQSVAETPTTTKGADRQLSPNINIFVEESKEDNNQRQDSMQQSPLANSATDSDSDNGDKPKKVCMKDPDNPNWVSLKNVIRGWGCIIGTNNEDFIQAIPNPSGGDLDNIIFGRDKPDVIFSDVGIDTVFGGAGGDTVQGGPGNDQIFGKRGDDHLFGGSDDDLLVGGSGNNHLFGDSGNDVLEGGKNSGANYFDCGDGYDVIIDFNPAKGDITAGNCEIF